jgi:hypothetical protein
MTCGRPGGGEVLWRNKGIVVLEANSWKHRRLTLGREDLTLLGNVR